MKQKDTIHIVYVVLRTVWRIALTAAAILILAVVGLHMVLETVFTGPSETARDQLTLTLLASEKTAWIPGHFLDQATIDAICAPAGHSVPRSDDNLITAADEAYSQTVTLELGNCTATVTLTRPGGGVIGEGAASAQNYVGFTSDGILAISSLRSDLETVSDISGCGAVLILDGQADEILYAAVSGFAPRTAIGQAADGTVIFVTTDGWTKEHPGATYRDLIDIMTQYGAVNACVLRSGNEE